jgi:hypothetical protein
MNVKVGNALTYAVVGRNERPVGAETLFDRASHALHPSEQRSELSRRHVAERLVMQPRHHEAMADEDGSVVEKGDGLRPFVDDVRLDVTGGDSTEETTRDLARAGHFAPIALTWRSASARDG